MCKLNNYLIKIPPHKRQWFVGACRKHTQADISQWPTACDGIFEKVWVALYTFSMLLWGHILFWKRLSIKITYLESFWLSSQPLETSLCVPKLGLGITDWDPSFKPSALGRSQFEKRKTEKILGCFLWCQQPMMVLQPSKPSATPMHIWSPSHASRLS